MWVQCDQMKLLLIEGGMKAQTQSNQQKKQKLKLYLHNGNFIQDNSTDVVI